MSAVALLLLLLCTAILTGTAGAIPADALSFTWYTSTDAPYTSGMDFPVRSGRRAGAALRRLTQRAA